MSQTHLKSEGVAQNVVEMLEGIKEQDIRGKGDFVNKLEDTIGKEQTGEHKSLIMEHSLARSVLPYSPNSSIHRFVINVFGNLTVLVVRYIASLFWPAPTRDELKLATWWTKNDRCKSLIFDICVHTKSVLLAAVLKMEHTHVRPARNRRFPAWSGIRLCRYLYSSQ